ncbi:double Clp-N motif P-loop nucleoside triphosphate hydrolase superfamily protein [Medicago truncatula]|uniref:Double Clp-N motif P-loop nucleoside triphosphate hydrolase superfamily protein n=1 Tax=Medicago truncatula TaxID=3880 RepID=A0A072TDM1_MEDTR|nr:double Clp-N motif P-loop nucleoside triphosphate hydrolase superfamily protein [Medicago truncatula]
MRFRICNTQFQALTQEAAILVKQAVKSHYTLLHKACLQCHSHPFQFKALEICFNVSLNRLPSSTISSTLFRGPRYLSPSLSNSLGAAFKSAQGHQRHANFIENQ